MLARYLPSSCVRLLVRPSVHTSLCSTKTAKPTPRTLYDSPGWMLWETDYHLHPSYLRDLLTYKVLHDSAPRYLRPLVAVADLPGRRALRSASTSRLVIPPIKLSTVGSRAFPVAAAQVWNGLPEAVISSSSLQSFRRQLKTHLFQL